MQNVIKVDFSPCYIFVYDPVLRSFIYDREIRGIERAKEYARKIEENKKIETKIICS